MNLSTQELFDYVNCSTGDSLTLSNALLDTISHIISLQNDVAALRRDLEKQAGKVSELDTHRENLAHVMNRVFVIDEEEPCTVSVYTIATGDFEELVGIGTALAQSTNLGQRTIGHTILKLLGVQAEYGEVAS